MKRATAALVVLAALLAVLTSMFTHKVMASGTIQTVFIILMENHNWTDLGLTPGNCASCAAPYMMNTLAQQGAFASRYFNPPSNHPSEPNYVWLEAGTCNFSDSSCSNYASDNDPGSNGNDTSSTAHLVTMMNNAGISWKGYMESAGGSCPLSSTGEYAAKHDPFVFFNDVTGNLNSSNAYCNSHIVDYSNFATDLASGNLARYVWITPNLIDDMHDGTIGDGDTWLSNNIPAIMASNAYKNNGMIFIVFDEGEGGSQSFDTGDGPIYALVLSPLGKVGYTNTISYDHSSWVRTVQNIFNLHPPSSLTYLGNAGSATDLSDLFLSGAIPSGLH